MEKVEIKYDQLKKSLQAYERSYAIFEKEYPTALPDYQETYTASVIKHFELLYEMLWKYAKLYIAFKFGDDVIGSKNIFRFLESAKIISQQELNSLLEIVENRNITAHKYDQEHSQQIIAILEKYYKTIKSLTDKIAL